MFQHVERILPPILIIYSRIEALKLFNFNLAHYLFFISWLSERLQFMKNTYLKIFYQTLILPIIYFYITFSFKYFIR